MTRRAAYLCAVVLGVLGVLGTGGPPAQAATSLPHLTVHLSRTTVNGGDPVTVTAHANALCDWIVEFHGDRRHTVGRSFQDTFIAPAVRTRTRLNVMVTCIVHSPPAKPRKVPGAGNSGSDHDVQALVVRIPANATVDPPLTVLPGGAVSPPGPPQHGHHGLPNTGGPAYWLVLAALVALLVGSVLVRLRRPSPQPSPE